MIRHIFALALLLAVVLAPVSWAAGTAFDEGAALAKTIVELSEIPQGVCAIVGAEDTVAGVGLLQEGGFTVHVLDTDGRTVEITRDALDKAGLYGEKIWVEQWAAQRMPYADNLVDIVVFNRLNDHVAANLPFEEVVRVLRPGGTALISLTNQQASDSQAIKNWTDGVAGVRARVKRTATGDWAVFTKDAPAGIDNWSHWEHGPDNNPVSTDRIIKAPYMTQWFGKPYYVAMPAITTAASGRVFLAMGHIAHHEREEPWLNTLVAQNGYNGTELWRKHLPAAYLAHRSAFIATDETFFMIDLNGTGCLLLDAATGEEKQRVYLPEVKGEWKWIALKNGVLYALIGGKPDPAETTIVRRDRGHWSWGSMSSGYYEDRIPWGFGRTLVAYDLNSELLLWRHDEATDIDSRALAVGGGRIYFYAPDSRLGALDALTGEVEWTNDDAEVRELIEQPGEGLTSTPGFRTSAYCVYAPEALCYAAQTRMNLVAVSTDEGALLWHRRKTTNNPNTIYLDGTVYAGLGPEGNTLALDPLTGETIADLGFKKHNCARLTATPDSLFLRGDPEGLTRFDRETQEILFNGALRPACNDGIIGANGLLYTGPWLCDCNLSLMGRIVLAPAGSFDFGNPPSAAERLEQDSGDIANVQALAVGPGDWPAYRGGSGRACSSSSGIGYRPVSIWTYNARKDCKPTAPAAAGGLVVFGADDGVVRAIDVESGHGKWSYATGGPIMQAPTLWNGRVYVGSGDGYVYALEARTGRLLWRFRAAPVERKIMVYGDLCSTWPVNSGVLVHDGVAYFAAGIIDYDGTYVYALDTVTGELKWQNSSSGHLLEAQRKGASAMGSLTIFDGKLCMAGGNVVGTAAYDLDTGEYVGEMPEDGSPRYNRGQEMAVFNEVGLLYGGRLRYSAEDNVVNPGRFQLETKSAEGESIRANAGHGRIPPAWDEELFVSLEGPGSKPTGYPVAAMLENFREGRNYLPKPLWTADALEGYDTTCIAVAGDAVLVACQEAEGDRYNSAWELCGLDRADGSLLWKRRLPDKPADNGILVDSSNRAVMTLYGGRVVGFGTQEHLKAMIERVADTPAKNAEWKEGIARNLRWLLLGAQTPETVDTALAGLEKLGAPQGNQFLEQGYVLRWNLLGQIYQTGVALYDLEQRIGRSESIDFGEPHRFGGRTQYWRDYFAHDESSPAIALSQVLGGGPTWTRGFMRSEIELPEDGTYTLLIGSYSYFTVWFNGENLGGHQGQGGNPHAELVPQAFTVTGKQGKNTLALRIDSLSWKARASVQVLDANGQPMSQVAR